MQRINKYNIYIYSKVVQNINFLIGVLHLQYKTKVKHA